MSSAICRSCGHCTSRTRVPAVIALIVHDHLAIAQKMAPERIIGVDRKAVAVRQHEARTAGAAVPAHANDRTIRHGKIEHRQSAEADGSCTDGIGLAALFGSPERSDSIVR